MISSVYFRHSSATATPGSSCSDGRNRPWVLLDTVAYIDDDIPHNATTAAASSRSGATVEVTFGLADPPALSSWSVRCTGSITKTRRPAQSPSFASVVRAEGSLLLLRVLANNSDDFFVYSAGSGNPPSLNLLPRPRPHPPALKPPSHNEAATLPLADRHYLVVIPVMQLTQTHRGCSYVLHVFSSKTARWSVKVPRVDWDDEETDYSNIVFHRGGKVVVIHDDGEYHGGGGRRLVVGWVDLWQGILTCDVLDARPVMRLIKLPPPRPGNMVDGWGMGYETTNDARSCRDVAYSNGCFRFAEIDFRSNYYDDTTIGLDFEIDYHNDDTMYLSNVTGVIMDNGWTATIWKRPVSSSQWSVCCTVDASEIRVSDSCAPHLLPEMRCDDEANKMDFNRVIAAAPMLGLRDDGLLHLMCKLKPGDSKAWVLAVDTENKRLQALALFSAQRMCSFEPTYTPCSFSSYLPRCSN